MSYWVKRDGSKILVSDMTNEHIFRAWKMFGREFSTYRSDILNMEIERRNLPHPKEYSTVKEFKKAINAQKIKERLRVK